MTARVDIAGVLERAGADEHAPEGSQAWALAQVGAAVAELIAADKECDTLSEELRRIDNAGPRHNSYGTGWEVRDRAHRKDLEKKFDAACVRRANAIARVGGA